MSYPNIFEFQADFEQETKFLGKGTFGEVHLLKSKRILNPELEKHLEGCDPFPGQLFAVKMMNAKSEKAFQTIQKEFLILKSLPNIHPHIISLYKTYAWANQYSKTYTLALAIELAEQSLQQEIVNRITNKTPFEDSEIIFIYKQCIDTLAEILNVYKILHRDIKPENILLQKGLQLKFTDFGVSRKLLQGKLSMMPGTLVGTPAYLSPILWDAFSNGSFQVTKINKIMHNLEKSDIYSLGISLLQVTLLLPQEVIGVLNKGQKGQLRTDELIAQIQNQRFREILEKMLVHDEKKRANYAELQKLLQEPFYKSVGETKKKQIFEEFQVEPVKKQFSFTIKVDDQESQSDENEKEKSQKNLDEQTDITVHNN